MKLLRHPGALAVSALFAFAAVAAFVRTPATARPTTLEQVVQQARDLGLYYASPRPDGLITDTVIISEHPIDSDVFRDLRLAERPGAEWNGKVFVYDPEETSVSLVQPATMDNWGALFVFGDQQMISRLADVH
jgi:hypothetical protein